MKKLTLAEQQALHTHGWTIMGQPLPQVNSSWEIALPTVTRTFDFALEPIEPKGKPRRTFDPLVQ